MESCEKYKNRGGKETEKEISKLFVSIPDWEEKSKPDFFSCKTETWCSGQAEGGGTVTPGWDSIFSGGEAELGCCRLDAPHKKVQRRHHLVPMGTGSDPELQDSC